MSESGDGGPGRREVAHRIFAAEFDDAEFSYSESDEERAPNYVVTPTGARVNRLFAVGVLTELEQVNEEVLRARVVDPTGAFVVYAGQYQPEALAFLEGATPPLFVAVTGKARTFEPEDGDRVFTSIRPESISEVDAETRDRWVVQAAEHTVARIGRLAGAKRSGLTGETLQSALVAAGVGESDAAGAALALDYYDTTGDYLQALRELSLNAARVVAGERDEAGTLSRSPGDGTDDPLAALSTIDVEAPVEDAAATEPTSDAETATPTASTESESVAGASEAETTTEPAASTDSSAEATESATAADEVNASPDPAETDETPTASADTTADETTAESTGDLAAETAEAESDSTAGGADEGTLGDFDSSDGVGDDGTDDSDDEVGEFDTEFELDEDEREEIEAEYGTDFQSGTEVDDAGEADIETPDPEELADAEPSTASESTATEPAAEASAETDTDPAAGTTTDAEPDSTASDAADTEDGHADAEDVDLEDAVMAAMKELDDGGGADRAAVVDEVVDRHGADPEAVADAIQDALMGGRCYEPDDGKLTPI